MNWGVALMLMIIRRRVGGFQCRTNVLSCWIGRLQHSLGAVVRMLVMLRSIHVLLPVEYQYMSVSRAREHVVMR